MADYIGKIDFSKLIGVKVADVDYGEIRKKCLVIPIEDNDITRKCNFGSVPSDIGSKKAVSRISL